MTKVEMTDLRRIARYLAVGYTQKEIAKKMNLPPSTISYSVKKIRKITRNSRDDNDAFNFILFGLQRDATYRITATMEME